MAFTVVNGATVIVTIGTATLKIASLSITTGQGTFDVSSFGTQLYVDRVGGGLRDLAGSCAGFVTSGAATQSPFALLDNGTGTMSITWFTGCTLTFSVVVGNITTDITRSGVGVLRFDWSKTSDSDPVIAWA